MTDLLLIMLIVVGLLNLMKPTSVTNSNQSDQLVNDIHWLRKYFEKKAKNKWDSTFYDPSNQDI